MMLPPLVLKVRSRFRLLHARAATWRVGPRLAGRTRAEPQP
ncbi:hypothetical protein LMG31886_00880 [Xanthomonas hydrangeae]|nr:hypothetical protein LMG31884_00870 [Xanthomonas hydrangeae]CAD7712416.1 hypothetical protein LMG31884_00870 [Xanthomonas hydrangeae]CAD7717405.1 hypothetical protein LMG31887_00870 [Xanthomonas hydrangeae]CAD7717407.1 hypothetical protein LMG31887_00870 [Xanthomonas hydrangeae]CAD7720036.1 hypothetical protein LMG31886_00880 [Xanthomonas hydrangeae]